MRNHLLSLEGEHPREQQIKKSLEALRKPQQAASSRDLPSRAPNFTAWGKPAGLSPRAGVKMSDAV